MSNVIKELTPIDFWRDDEKTVRYELPMLARCLVPKTGINSMTEIAMDKRNKTNSTPMSACLRERERES